MKDRLRDELRDHIDRLTSDFIAQGIDPAEAAPWAVVRNVVGREVGARRAVWGS